MKYKKVNQKVRKNDPNLEIDQMKTKKHGLFVFQMFAQF